MLITWRQQRLSLSMNRVYLIVLFLIVVSLGSINAQKYEGWGINYTNVLSYDGVKQSKAFTVRIESILPFNIEKGWKMSVKAMPRDSKKEFPMQKVSLLPHAVEGTASNPGPLPTLTQLGIPPINNFFQTRL